MFVSHPGRVSQQHLMCLRTTKSVRVQSGVKGEKRWGKRGIRRQCSEGRHSRILSGRPHRHREEVWIFQVKTCLRKILLWKWHLVPSLPRRIWRIQGWNRQLRIHSELASNDWVHSNLTHGPLPLFNSRGTTKPFFLWSQTPQDTRENPQGILYSIHLSADMEILVIGRAPVPKQTDPQGLAWGGISPVLVTPA